MFKRTVSQLKEQYHITISNSGPGRTMLMDATVTPKALLGEFHSSQLALAERSGGAAGVAALVGHDPIPGTGVPMPEFREQKTAYVQAKTERLPSVDPNQPIETQLARLQKQAPPGSELEADLAAAQAGIGATPESFLKAQRESRAEAAAPAPPPASETETEASPTASSKGDQPATASETDFMEPEK